MKYLLPILLLSLLLSSCQSGEKKKDNDKNNQKQFIEPPKHNKDTGQVYLIYPAKSDSRLPKS